MADSMSDPHAHGMSESQASIDRRMMLMGGGVLGAMAVARKAMAGPLEPPAGPVVPTHKTLTEVEPRTPVQQLSGSSSAVHVIDKPGSYYLTENITGVSGKNGIVVKVDGVTLDMCGFLMQGVTGSLTAVLPIGTRRAISVLNGVVTGWVDGVRAGADSMIAHIRAYGNSGTGLETRDRGLVMDCISTQNGAFGISVESSGRVIRCTVQQCGWRGIDTADDCFVSECVVSGCAQSGVDTGNNCVVERCIVHGNLGSGVLANGSRCFIHANACDSNQVAGISVPNSGCRIEANSLQLNSKGIEVNGSGNLLVCNVLRGNSISHSVSAANSYGPFVSVAGVGDFSSVAGGSHPFVNLIY